jgi:hypothetical protein
VDYFAGIGGETGPCAPPISGSSGYVAIRYFLIANCAGTGQWQLRISFAWTTCNDGTGLVRRFCCSYHPDPSYEFLDPLFASSTIPLNCNVAGGLTFSLPTSVSGLATPGGGGTLVVSP